MASTPNYVFSNAFLHNWQLLLELLRSSYEVLTFKPDRMGRALSLMKKGAPPEDLPEDHPFRSDYEEFELTFEHGLMAYRDNASIIARHQSLDAELYCLDHAMFVAKNYLNDFAALKETLTRHHIGAVGTSIEINERLSKDLPNQPTTELEVLTNQIGDNYNVQLLSSVDGFAETVDSLNKVVKEAIPVWEARVVELRKRRKLKKKEKYGELRSARYEAEERNQKLETRLRHFYIRFLSHFLGLV